MCSSKLSVGRLLQRGALLFLILLAIGVARDASAAPEDAPIPPTRRDVLQPGPPIDLSSRPAVPEPSATSATRQKRPGLQGLRGVSPAVPPHARVPSRLQRRERKLPPTRGGPRTTVTNESPEENSTTGGGGGGKYEMETLSFQGTGGSSPALPSPPASASFAALGDNATRFNPDTSGAVSTDHLMVALASEIRIQRRDGTEISRMSQEAFWSELGSFSVFDTRLLYDPYGQRWIHLAAAGGTNDPGLLLAISQSSDPTGTWFRYFIDTDVDQPIFPESPNIGFNKKWITVQANMFYSTNFFFAESQIFVLNKANLYAGGPADFSMFTLSQEEFGDAINAQVPAITYDPNVEEHFLVGHWNNYVENEFGLPLGSIRVYIIAGTVDFPNLTPGNVPQVARPWARVAPAGEDFLPQMGITNEIAAGDSRIQNAVYRNGSLWSTHTVFLPALEPAVTAVQWWEVLPLTGSIFQFGRVGGTNSSTFYAYPSIAVNAQNDVLVGFSSFSEDRFPSASYAFKTDDLDEPDVLRPPALLKPGEASFYVPDGSRNRWGDWSATVVDPVNDIDLWTIQEYAATPVEGEDRWGTWWGRVSPDVDLSVAMTGSPSSLLAGETIEYSVTITNFNQAKVATGVQLLDQLPPGTAFVTATPDRGTCRHDNGLITCDLGDLVEDDIATVQIVLRTMTDGQIENTVAVSAYGPELFPEDNVASVVSDVAPAADLHLAVTASPTLPFQDQDLFYDIVVTNLGPSTAPTVKFTNYLPENVTYLRTQPSQGACSRSGNRIICNFGSLNRGERASATITVQPDGGGLLTNQTLVGSVVIDPRPADNEVVTTVRANALPTIDAIDTQTIDEDAVAGPIPFAVQDLETAGADLVVTASSEDPSLLPEERIQLGGSGNNRTVTLSPLPNAFGNIIVTLQVTDQDGASASSTFLLRVLSVNDAPFISSIPDQVIDEDTSTAEIPFVIGDVEKDASALGIGRASSNTSLIPATKIFLGGSGANRTVRVEPNADQFGQAVIEIRVSDGAIVTTESFTVTVNPVNDDPTLSSLADRSSNEDTSTPLFGFTIGDAESSTADLTVRALSSNPTLLPVANIELGGGTDASRTFRLTPAPDENGTSLVTLVLSDPDGGQTQGSFLYTVNPINDNPFIDPLPDLQVDEDSGPVVVDLTGIAAGPTNEFQVIDVTASSSVNARIPNPIEVEYSSPEPTGRLILNLATNANGTANITVRVRDDQPVNALTTVSFAVEILPVNDPPSVDPIPDQTIDEDTSTETLSFSVSDVETATGFLTLSAASSNPDLVPVENVAFGGFGGSRNVTVTPAPDAFGTATISVHVSDGTDVTTRQFTVTVRPVNDRPSLLVPADQSVLEDTPIGPLPLYVFDPETATVELSMAASSSNPQLISDDNITFAVEGTNVTLRLLPLPDQAGEATISLQVTDPEGLSASGSFQVSVQPVNDPPTLDPIADLTVEEDAGPHAVSLTGIGTGAPNESQPLTVIARSGNPDLLPDPVVQYTSPDTTGTLQLAPRLHAAGTVLVTVEVQDDGPTNQISRREFLLVINPVNDLPVISPIPDQVTDEDVPTEPIPFSVRDVETAPENLVIFGLSSNEELIFSTDIQIEGSGTNRTVTITPLADQSGSAFVFIRAEDEEGASVIEQFQVVVHAVNDPPSIQPVSDQGTREDVPVGPIAVTVFDPETPPDQLTLTARSDNTDLLPLANIQLGGSGINRSLTLAPATDAFGQATVELTVSDGSLAAQTSLVLTVDPVNDPPTLDPITDVTLDEGATRQVEVTGIGSGSANEPQSLVLTATSDRTDILPHPTVAYSSPEATGQLTLAPLNNASGQATVTVKVNDGAPSNHLAQQTFLVTVRPINDPPFISSIPNQVVDEDTPTPPLDLTIRDAETPPDNLLLFASSSNEELVFSGDIVVSGTGENRTLTVTPLPEQSGTVSIFLSVQDAEGLQATTEFTLTVNNVEDLPVIHVPSTVTLNEDSGPVVVDVVFEDPDTPEGTLLWEATSDNQALVPNSQFRYGGFDANRTLTFAPLTNAFGNATISLRVLDGPLSTNTQFQLQVRSVNDQPTLAPLPDRIEYQDASSLVIPLTDISSGAPNENQTLTLTARSSSPGVIPHPALTYSSPDDSGTLELSRASQGETTIILELVDDGDTSFGGRNTLIRAFSYSVLDPRDLRIWLEDGTVKLAWLAAAGDFILESRNALDGSPWTVVPETPVQVGVEWVVTLPLSSGSRFFQLRSP